MPGGLSEEQAGGCLKLTMDFPDLAEGVSLRDFFSGICFSSKNIPDFWRQSCKCLEPKWEKRDKQLTALWI